MQGHSPPGSRSDRSFLTVLVLIGSLYFLLVLGFLLADAAFVTPTQILKAFHSPEIRYSIRLSFISCTVTMILSVWIGIPVGYVMARYKFPGKSVLDSVIDIPIVLPPLVVGLSLLLLFQSPLGRLAQRFVPVTYEIPAVILAQFSVACAFAIRTLRMAFEQIHPRREQVALTLGCNRRQAFWRVLLPEARGGILTAASLAWARSLGEFGPVLVFAGATRMRTEVLPTTVFLELSVGNLEGAVAVSLIMVGAAIAVLLLIRGFGFDPNLKHLR